MNFQLSFKAEIIWFSLFSILLQSDLENIFQQQTNQIKRIGCLPQAQPLEYWKTIWSQWSFHSSYNNLADVYQCRLTATEKWKAMKVSSELFSYDKLLCFHFHCALAAAAGCWLWYRETFHIPQDHSWVLSCWNFSIRLLFIISWCWCRTQLQPAEKEENMFCMDFDCSQSIILACVHKNGSQNNSINVENILNRNWNA